MDLRKCIDCKWCIPRLTNMEMSDCSSPRNVETSPVTGERKGRFSTCLMARIAVTGCGANAEWFTAKEGAHA